MLCPASWLSHWPSRSALTPRTAGTLPTPRGEYKVLVWTLLLHRHIVVCVCVVEIVWLGSCLKSMFEGDLRS